MGETSQNNTQFGIIFKGYLWSLASIVPSELQSFLESTTTESSKCEFLIYLDEQNISVTDNKKFDLLNLCKVNAHRVSVVSSMAKKVISNPC
jgi:hypothetical protein